MINRQLKNIGFMVLGGLCGGLLVAQSDLAVASAPTAGKPSGDVRGFVQNIEQLTLKNQDFRHVLYTAPHSQLVVMSLKPGEDIGEETHADVDQFLRVEQGAGEAILNGTKLPIKSGFAVLVPAGTKHNIVNTGGTALKLYTLYAPPNHRDGVVHRTKAQAEHDTEHFDGKTTH